MLIQVMSDYLAPLFHRQEKRGFVGLSYMLRQQSRAGLRGVLAGELALHGFGTEPDSWHSEDDL